MNYKSNNNAIYAKPRDMIYIAVFLILVLLLWAGLSLLPGPQQIQLDEDVQGGYDLVESDFEDTIYTIAPVWDSWPEKLYTPEELDTAEAPVPHESVDYTQTEYATHRLHLKLAPGVTYGLSYYSSDYSMRLYIDGVEMASAGTPGSTREETEPLVRKLVTYFTPQSETVTLVVQSANFVHFEGGWAPMLTVGTADSIAQYERITDLKTGLVFGCLMTACLYYLAIFLLNRRQVSSLVFSILCLLLALVSGDFLAQLFSAYSWQLSIRLEYSIYVLAAATLAGLVRFLFPSALNKWVFRIYLLLCSLYIGIILFTNSVFFTTQRMGFQVLSIAMIVYGIICLALILREKKLKNALAFLGILLFALFIIADILLRYTVQAINFLAGKTFNAAGGMVLFVFCYAVVLSIEQAEINARLEESRIALAAAEERYHELVQKQTNGHSSAKIIDFGLTKRETEVTFLLLDGKTREEIARLLSISMGTVNSHCSNIYRKTECGNVADLVRALQPGKIEKSDKEEKSL